MLRNIGLFIILFFVIGLLLNAQDDTVGWVMEQHCVPDAIDPPDDWTFDGAILMRGHYGVHAVSAQFDMPYVVAFINWENIFSDVAFSPDMEWMVMTEGRFDIYINPASPTAQGFTNFYGLWLHTTSVERNKFFIPFRFFDYYFGGIWKNPLPQPMWVDTQHITFEGQRINPFTGNIEDDEEFTRSLTQSVGGGEFPSPDWTRIINVYFNPGSTTAYIKNLETNESSELGIIINEYDWFGQKDMIWARDSLAFSFQRYTPEIEDISSISPRPTQTVLFDRDGNFVDVIFDSRDDEIYSWVDGDRQFSPNGRYFAFFASETDPQDSAIWTLLIADLEAEGLINTCITANSTLSWSPDGTQIALKVEEGNTEQVHILDMERWEIMRVAYHEGRILGWRD